MSSGNQDATNGNGQSSPPGSNEPPERAALHASFMALATADEELRRIAAQSQFRKLERERLEKEEREAEEKLKELMRLRQVSVSQLRAQTTGSPALGQELRQMVQQLSIARKRLTDGSADTSNAPPSAVPAPAPTVANENPRPNSTSSGVGVASTSQHRPQATYSTPPVTYRAPHQPHTTAPSTAAATGAHNSRSVSYTPATTTAQANTPHTQHYPAPQVSASRSQQANASTTAVPPTHSASRTVPISSSSSSYPSGHSSRTSEVQPQFQPMTLSDAESLALFKTMTLAQQSQVLAQAEIYQQQSQQLRLLQQMQYQQQQQQQSRAQPTQPLAYRHMGPAQPSQHPANFVNPAPASDWIQWSAYPPPFAQQHQAAPTFHGQGQPTAMHLLPQVQPRPVQAPMQAPARPPVPRSQSAQKPPVEPRIHAPQPIPAQAQAQQWQFIQHQRPGSSSAQHVAPRHDPSQNVAASAPLPTSNVSTSASVPVPARTPVPAPVPAIVSGPTYPQVPQQQHMAPQQQPGRLYTPEEIAYLQMMQRQHAHQIAQLQVQGGPVAETSAQGAKRFAPDNPHSVPTPPTSAPAPAENNGSAARAPQLQVHPTSNSTMPGTNGNVGPSKPVPTTLREIVKQLGDNYMKNISSGQLVSLPTTATLPPQGHQMHISDGPGTFPASVSEPLQAGAHRSEAVPPLHVATTLDINVHAAQNEIASPTNLTTQSRIEEIPEPPVARTYSRQSSGSASSTRTVQEVEKKTLARDILRSLGRPSRLPASTPVAPIVIRQAHSVPTAETSDLPPVQQPKRRREDDKNSPEPEEHAERKRIATEGAVNISGFQPNGLLPFEPVAYQAASSAPLFDVSPDMATTTSIDTRINLEQAPQSISHPRVIPDNIPSPAIAPPTSPSFGSSRPSSSASSMLVDGPPLHSLASKGNEKNITVSVPSVDSMDVDAKPPASKSETAGATPQVIRSNCQITRKPTLSEAVGMMSTASITPRPNRAYVEIPPAPAWVRRCQQIDEAREPGSFTQPFHRSQSTLRDGSWTNAPAGGARM